MRYTSVVNSNLTFRRSILRIELQINRSTRLVKFCTGCTYISDLPPHKVVAFAGPGAARIVSGGRWNKLAWLGLIYIFRSLVLGWYFMQPPSPTSTLAFGAMMGFLWLGVGPLVRWRIAPPHLVERTGWRGERRCSEAC
jgi:hypothetical protein